MAEYTGNQSQNNSTSVAPEVRSVPPTINNNTAQSQQNYAYPVVYTQPQVIYTTPVQTQTTIQPQTNTNQNDSITRQLAMQQINSISEENRKLKTELQQKNNLNNQQQLNNTTLNNISNQMIQDSNQRIQEIYEGRQKAEEERQKEFKRLKEENEKFRKEKDEVNKNQEIDNKIEERYGSEMEEKDIEIAKLQDEIADIQGAKEMLEQQIDELGGISMKDILLEEEESRKKHLEQLKEIAHRHNDALSSETNKLTNLEGELNKKQESIGIIKKILMFFGGSEPKDITELREKIEKAREQMKDLQQNVSDSNKELRENEKEYLKFINRKITTINNLHENQRNEVEQRDKMMQEIKNSKENQDEIKQMLKDRNGLNNMRNTNYINRLRMDEQAKEDMYEKIKASKMYDKKQKDIYSNRAKYGTKSMQMGNSMGRK